MTKFGTRFLSWFLIVLLMLPLEAMPQTASSTGFSKAQIAQMVAPIALYPDSLVAQILMASTYPLEVVEADRWVKQNPNLKGDALNEALKDKSWDVSVKSLCHYPDVLSGMSQNLSQTSQLGDAVLSQQSQGSSCGQSADNRAAEGDYRPFGPAGDRNRACQPTGCICAYIQYCGGLRLMAVPCLSTLFTLVLPRRGCSGRRCNRIWNWICARIILMGLV